MGRTLLRMTLALCALVVARHAAAATSEFQITPRAGIGELRINELVGVNDDLVDTDTMGIGVGFGVLTPIGVVLEAGADSFGDFDFFNALDSFSLTQQFVSVGYQLELGDGWRLVPRAGHARWKLRSEEGLLFNSGPEQSRDARGYDYYWELSVSRRVSRTVTLGLNYKQGNYEFGRTRATAFLVTLGF